MSSTLPPTQTLPGAPGPSSVVTPTKRVVVRISNAARQLLLDYYTNIGTHPPRDARITLAQKVSRLDNIQYTTEQVSNWFVNRRNSSRNIPDRSASAHAAPPLDTQHLDHNVVQALDTLFTRTPTASDRDVGRWCNDLQIPLLQGLRLVDQMRARRNTIQTTSLPTPSSTASPEVRSLELPIIIKVEQETGHESEAATDSSRLDRARSNIAPCPWLDDLAARPMPPPPLETVKYGRSGFVPSTLAELDSSFGEFRATLARLHGKTPNQDDNPKD
ncbi:unnamed protein product [Peniophora sp. CBMAI 1063]|nr:unnamed protein product [Peniophora sp. CBMAI 1063]